MHKLYTRSALFVLVLSPQVALATTVIGAPLTELAHSSDVIFHGVVKRVDNELATSKAGPFRTELELEVVEAIKGLPSGQATFRLVLPGGRGFGRVMAIPGMPRFFEGDEVVLLLERTRRGFALTGLGQGVFKVDRGQVVPVAHRDLRGMAIVDRTGKPTHLPTELGDEPSLEALLTHLRDACAEGDR